MAAVWIKHENKWSGISKSL